MIGQQADLHRVLVEVRRREGIDAVFDDRPGDRERVDLIGLAGLALSSTRRAHSVRRNADDALAGRDQRLFKAP